MTPRNVAPSGKAPRILFRDYQNATKITEEQAIMIHELWLVQTHKNKDVYFFLGFKDPATGQWIEHAVAAPITPDKVLAVLRRYPRKTYDQYFCPNPFSKPKRKKQFALPTLYAWCDMDESDPEDYEPLPSLVWSTSRHRYQGLWLWDKKHSPDEAEAYSKALAYGYGGDRNGWSHTKMLRIIGSINHKPCYDKPFVKSVEFDWVEIAERPFLLERHKRAKAAQISANPTMHKRLDVLKRYAKKLHPKVIYLIRHERAHETDRSSCLFLMIAGLYEAGAAVDEIAAVLWDSPYFVGKHGHNITKLNDELTRVIGKLEVKV